MKPMFEGDIYLRFFQRIKKSSSGCWEWTKGRDTDGYGRFYSRSLEETRAHRAAFKLFLGEIPNTLLVRHTCHNPSCCNPKHLMIGTSKDNAQDCVRAGRSGTGFKNGRCKINKEELLYIISQKGKVSAKKLAKYVSINSSQIYKIWNGEHKYEI